MEFTYFISFNGSDWTEFYPLSPNKITWKLEAGEIFKRPTINEFGIGQLLNPSVYSTLESSFTNTATFGTFIYFKIKKNGTDTFYFKASINEGKIDSQNGVYYISPKPNDTYETILAKYNIKYQDRNAVGIFGANTTLYYPVIDTGNFVNVSFSTFSDVAKTVTWTNTTGATQVARNIQTVTPVTNHRYVIIISGFSGDFFTMRLVNSVFAAISSDVDVNADGKYILTQTSAAVGSIYVEMYNDGVPTLSGQFTYDIYAPNAKATAGGPLKTVLTNLLTNGVYMNLSSLSIRSTYLFNDPLPTGAPPNISTYISANPTRDYVVEGAAIWNDLYMTRSDIWSSSPDPVFSMSLREIMDILKTKLRAWWFIDADGYVRIEHEKYFNDFASQIDLTSGTYSGYKPEVDARVYNYDKSDIYSSINYKENNEVNEDFVAFPILYDAVKTTNNINDINITSVSTDGDNLFTNPTTIQKDGVALFATIKSGTLYHVDVNESVITAGNYYPNEYLSWAYLFKYYWGYFGEADSATINGDDTLNTDGVKYFKKQTDIKFYYNGIIDWMKPVTTVGGKAWLDAIELDLESGWYNLDVEYDPYN